MSNYATIARLLLSELYNVAGATHCGPDLAYTQYHPDVKIYPALDVPLITPSQCFHPKLAVVFDFTYKFTADFTSTTGFTTERPVAKETLERVGEALTRFFDYYFEYVLSYGKRADKSKTNFQFGLDTRSAIRQLVDWSSKPPEDDVNQFINEVLNFFLMGVSVEKTVNEVGGCTISFTDNYNFVKNKKVRLLFDQTFGILNQLFVPMVPVMAWASGRLYPDWMFPIFDGYITSPDSSVTGGFSELQVHCKDVLELARISTEMVNPSLIQNSELMKKTHINIFSQPLFGMDHLEIVQTLFRGGDLVFDPERQRLVSSVSSFLTSGSSAASAASVGFTKRNILNFAALGEFDLYQDQNLTSTQTPAAELARGAVLRTEWNLKTALQTCSHKRRRGLIIWGQSITPYRLFATTSPQTFTGEFSSRLEILQNIAQLVYYTFYVDGYGDVHYHPRRLTNDFLQHEVISAPYGNMTKIPYNFPGSQVIGEGETTNSSSRVNVDELTTFLRVEGQDPFASPDSNAMLMVGSAVDENYMARFGYRRKSIRNELFNYNPVLADRDGKQLTLMDLCAKALLQFSNSELYTSSRTLIFRPELKIAAPVLFFEDDDVFYCQSASHSIRMNGEATTTINGNLGRKFLEAPTDLMSFIILNEKIYKYDGAPPPPPANATPEDIQRYYATYYGINEIPFAKWLRELDSQQKMFDTFEREKSKGMADMGTAFD